MNATNTLYNLNQKLNLTLKKILSKFIFATSFIYLFRLPLESMEVFAIIEPKTNIDIAVPNASVIKGLARDLNLGCCILGA